MHDAATFTAETDSEIFAKSQKSEIGILVTENEEVYDFIVKALVATLDDTLTADDLVALTLEIACILI